MRRFVGLIAAIVLALVTAAACGGAPKPVHRASPHPVPANIAVFLAPDVTDAEQQTIATTLQSAPGVQTVTFISREQTYRAFKKAFGDRPGLIKTIRPEQMPESYQVRLTDPAKATAIMTKTRTLPGVASTRLQTTGTPLPQPS